MVSHSMKKTSLVVLELQNVIRGLNIYPPTQYVGHKLTIINPTFSKQQIGKQKQKMFGMSNVMVAL